MILTRDQILSAAPPALTVLVREWGGEVALRRLGIKARVMLLDALYLNQSYNEKILTILFSIVDQDGELLFSIDDYRALANLSHATTESLWDAICRLNDFGSAYDMEQAEKARFRRSEDRRFMFRLALALGRTIAELDATMTPAELREWQAYYYFEPWGVPATDDRWRAHYSLFWSANSKPNSRIPTFLDRDWEETARREAAMTLDDKIELFFTTKTK